LLLGSVALLGSREASDGDLGFHLATGREILRSGRIPSRNLLSFTEPEQVWLLHQGLSGAVFEWLSQHAGSLGLWALRLGLLFATWLCTYAASRALRVSTAWASAVTLLAVHTSSFRFELRPYLFTHLALAAVVWALAWCAAGRYPLRPALTIFAAISCGFQLHAGGLDSVIVTGLFALGTLLEGVRTGQPTYRRAGLCGVSAVSGVLAAAAWLSAYHPLGARVLLVPFQMATHGYWGEHLVEFRHAWKLPLQLLWPYWLWLALVAWAVVRQARTLHLGLTLCTLVYAALSLWYVRMVYAFAIISAPVVALAVQTWWQQRPRLEMRPALAWCLLCAVTLTQGLHGQQLGLGSSEWVWPRAQFEFVRRHQLQGRAFVSDAWAGSFLGEFYPERRAFFDTRIEAYSDHFARDVYQNIRYGAEGWDSQLARYDVEFLMLRYTTPGEAEFARQGHDGVTLRQRLVHDPRYTLVYFDDVGELFVRTAGQNAALARTHAIVGVDPDRHTFLGPPARAAATLLRAATSGMQSETALGLTALALADAGDVEHARALTAVLRERSPDGEFTRAVVASLDRAR
jgi:hypothetical protein